ncbi:MAG: Chorismate dehydratase [Phycisphaerae bacterium]|nr:Chorismate dehydratase [Phycisphaerae bacterium]
MIDFSKKTPDSLPTPWQVGVVSYLNSRPLIVGLERHPAVRLHFAVPARLADELLIGRFDAALIPVIDLLRPEASLTIIASAAIACHGETLTVRVFSRIPPQEIETLAVDPESHTSVALVQILWRELYHRTLRVVPYKAVNPKTTPQSMLLIGDKVVAVDRQDYRYQVDLGGAWKTWTGLPFVFAVWAGRQQREYTSLSQLLEQARDRGVKQAGQLAVEYGPSHGWPVQLAQHYFQRYLQFVMTDQHVEGLVRFLDLVRQHGLAPSATITGYRTPALEQMVVE